MFDHPLSQLYLSCCDCVFFPQSSLVGEIFKKKKTSKRREKRRRETSPRNVKRERARERFVVERGGAFLVCSLPLFSPCALKERERENIKERYESSPNGDDEIV